LKLNIGIDDDTYEVEAEFIEEDEVLRQPFREIPQPMTPAAWLPMPEPVHPHAESPRQQGNEDKLCRSPLNGIVIRANVASGQTVTENELLMVLEAMKMETNVTARHAGTVKAVRVAPGESVKLNQVIVELE